MSPAHSSGAACRLSRESGSLAEVLSPRATVLAFSASPAEPRDADAITDFESFHRASDLHHLPNDLVPQHERESWVGEIAVGDMQISSAHAAGRDCEEYLARSGFGLPDVRFLQRPIGSL
jgi:hypothetical protein